MQRENQSESPSCGGSLQVVQKLTHLIFSTFTQKLMKSERPKVQRAVRSVQTAPLHEKRYRDFFL